MLADVTSPVAPPPPPPPDETGGPPTSDSSLASLRSLEAECTPRLSCCCWPRPSTSTSPTRSTSSTTTTQSSLLSSSRWVSLFHSVGNWLKELEHVRPAQHWRQQLAFLALCFCKPINKQSYHNNNNNNNVIHSGKLSRFYLVFVRNPQGNSYFFIKTTASG